MTDTPTGYPGAPPGWYPDPAGGPGQRWWDGYAWTDTVVEPSRLPPPPVLPPLGDPGPARPVGLPMAYAPAPPGHGATIAGLVRHELLITRAARVAAAMPAISVVASLILQQYDAAQLRRYGHQIHLIYIAAQNNQPAPTFTDTANLNPLSSIVGLCALAAIIVAAIWQFRAATAARALGRPARHSPGWGVGCWFVPIVNCFMPYQALRDCLAPDDPQRALILRWWLALIGMELLSAAAAGAAFFSQGAGQVFSFPAALLAVMVFVLGPRVVTVISASHQHAVNP